MKKTPNGYEWICIILSMLLIIVSGSLYITVSVLENNCSPKSESDICRNEFGHRITCKGDKSKWIA